MGANGPDYFPDPTAEQDPPKLFDVPRFDRIAADDVPRLRAAADVLKAYYLAAQARATAAELNRKAKGAGDAHKAGMAHYFGALPEKIRAKLPEWARWPS